MGKQDKKDRNSPQIEAQGSGWRGCPCVWHSQTTWDQTPALPPPVGKSGSHPTGPARELTAERGCVFRPLGGHLKMSRSRRGHQDPDCPGVVRGAVATRSSGAARLDGGHLGTWPRACPGPNGLRERWANGETRNEAPQCEPQSRGRCLHPRVSPPLTHPEPFPVTRARSLWASWWPQHPGPRWVPGQGSLATGPGTARERG